MVTFSSDLRLRGQRSNFKQRQMAKLTVPQFGLGQAIKTVHGDLFVGSLLSGIAQCGGKMWCPRWPHRHTYSWGPKVKNVIFKQHLNCKTTSANVGFDKHAKLSTGICVRSSALRPAINGMKSKVNQVIWPSEKKRQRQGPCHRDDTAISSSYTGELRLCSVSV